MKKKTRIDQISILVVTLLLTAFPVRADDLAAPVPAPADFWVRDPTGRITHACGGKEPLVLCMQGRKVVMQVQSDHTTGFSYTARFFNLQKEVEKKQALFVAGRESTPEVRINDQPWKSEFPSSVTFDGMLTLTYPEAGGVVVTRTAYPSMTRAVVLEEWRVRNATGKRVAVTVAPARTVKPVGEDIAIVWSCPGVKAAEVEAGGVLSFSTFVQAGLAAGPVPAVNVAAERGARLALAEAVWRGLGRLETPESILDHAFALQKLHVLETDRTRPADGKGFAWESSVPSDCPFPKSPRLTGLFFTGRHSDYRCGDTFYPIRAGAMACVCTKSDFSVRTHRSLTDHIETTMKQHLLKLIMQP